MTRYHKIDAWRGYEIPEYAVAGSSYTGEWSDSPAPKSEVMPELKEFMEYLKKKGIKSRLKTTPSSNVFMQKIWVVVPEEDFKKAIPLTMNWLKRNYSRTQYIHDADLDVIKRSKKNLKEMV